MITNVNIKIPVMCTQCVLHTLSTRNDILSAHRIQTLSTNTMSDSIKLRLSQ